MRVTIAYLTALLMFAGCDDGGGDGLLLDHLRLQATLNTDVPGAFGVTVAAGRACANTTYGAMTVAINAGADANVTGALESSPRVFDRARPVVANGHYYFSAHSTRVDVIDASAPASLQHVAQITATGLVRDLELVGATLYVADESAGVIAYDVANPAAPTLIGTVNPGPAYGIAATSSHVFIAALGNLVTVSISSGAFEVVGSRPFGPGAGGSVDLELSGDRLFVTGSVYLGAYDISAPASPEPLIPEGIGVVAPGAGAAIAVVGDRVYAARDAGTIAVFDVSNAASWKLLGSLPGDSDPPILATVYDVAVDEQHVYVAHSNGLLIFGQ